MKAETVGNACRCKKCNAKSRIIDLTGQRFGRLVAIEHAGGWLTKVDLGLLYGGANAIVEKSLLFAIHCLLAAIHARAVVWNVKTKNVW